MASTTIKPNCRNVFGREFLGVDTPGFSLVAFVTALVGPAKVVGVHARTVVAGVGGVVCRNWWRTCSKFKYVAVSLVVTAVDAVALIAHHASPFNAFIRQGKRRQKAINPSVHFSTSLDNDLSHSRLRFSLGWLEVRAGWQTRRASYFSPSAIRSPI